jgi:hypothetical protein
MKLENELLLRAAEIAVAESSEEELRKALGYAWTVLLRERENHEDFATEILGVPMVCSGHLLPASLRSRLAVTPTL